MAVILAGTDTNGTNNMFTGYVVMCRFQAVATGTSTEFHIYADATGNVKYAVYADSSGEPGTRLWYQDSSTSVGSTGWVTLPCAGVSITSGTYYYLAVTADTNGVFTRLTSGNPRIYKTNTYSTWTYPDPAGSGWTADNFTCCYSLYGTVGWANIARFNGILASSISKVNGIATTSISKLNGVSV